MADTKKVSHVVHNASRHGIDRSQKDHYVVKSNDLIRNARYSLTTQQHKLILYAVSKITPTDPAGTKYDLKIADICRLCGWTNDDGGIPSYYYSKLKEDISELTKRHWMTINDDGEIKTITFSFLGDCEIKEGSGTVGIYFNPTVAKHLFSLKKNYTQYKLESILTLNNRYAIRIYELLRSYISEKQLKAGEIHEVVFDVDDLRMSLLSPSIDDPENSADNYPRWSDFNRYVIKRAVDEINEHSVDLHVDYEPEKSGRQVTRVKFMLHAPEIDQVIKAKVYSGDSILPDEVIASRPENLSDGSTDWIPDDLNS